MSPPCSRESEVAVFQDQNKSGWAGRAAVCVVMEGDLFNLLDGKVEQDRAAGIMAHLGECVECAALHRALVHTDALLRAFCEEAGDGEG